MFLHLIPVDISSEHIMQNFAILPDAISPVGMLLVAVSHVGGFPVAILLVAICLVVVSHVAACCLLL